jgi:excisionase family DNA binding protein
MMHRETRCQAEYLANLIATPVEQPDVPGDGLLSESQAARRAGVSQKTIRRCIKRGELQAVDYGSGGKHLYRIAPAALEALNKPAEPMTPNAIVSSATPPRRRRHNRQSLSTDLTAYLPRVSSPAPASAKVGSSQPKPHV